MIFILLQIRFQIISLSNLQDIKQKIRMLQKENTYLAQSILMVRPTDFSFNQQASLDNQFMKKPDITSQQLYSCIIKEYEESIRRLKQAEVEVIQFDKQCYPQLKEIKLPDAVFPNNWFSTTYSSIILYRMRCLNRTLQKLQFPFIYQLLQKKHFKVQKVINWSKSIIQGTGSLIFDRKFKRVYAAKSQRCQGNIKQLVQLLGYELIDFEAVSIQSGESIYHSNVMLSIGQEFVVVATENIKEDYRQRVITKLKEQRQLIKINPQQCEKYFCGNILQIANTKKQKIVVASELAWKGYSQMQKQILQKQNKIVLFPLKWIESVGGGSARCMIAEIFLQKQ